MQADIGIMTKSRNRQVDAWMADHAQEMTAAWRVLRVDRHRLHIPGAVDDEVRGGQCAVARLAT
eukprot:836641-Pyramimonas_sp.AAC.1